MTKVLTGTFLNPDNTPVANGTLYLKLVQDAVVTGTGQIAPSQLAFALDASGTLGTGVTIYGSDELTPPGVSYAVTVATKGGGVIYGPEFFAIQGVSPISLNSLQPSTNSPVVFSSAILSNPTAPQSITGQSLTLSSTAPLIVQGGVRGLVPSQQTFTSSGTFTIPTGITAVKVTVVGGGGAGGGATVGGNIGGGGGAGGLTLGYLSGLTPGNTLTVTIGAGGTGVSGASGNSGSATSVSSGTQIISSFVANGGSGGTSGASPAGGGTGASVGSGGIPFLGNSGGIAFTGAGGNGGASFVGGAPAGSGAVGLNAPVNSGCGGSGSGPGGAPTSGGNGANGIVIFEWVQ
jgi:hypothetical protein